MFSVSDLSHVSGLLKHHILGAKTFLLLRFHRNLKADVHQYTRLTTFCVIPTHTYTTTQLSDDPMFYGTTGRQTREAGGDAGGQTTFLILELRHNNLAQSISIATPHLHPQHTPVTFPHHQYPRSITHSGDHRRGRNVKKKNIRHTRQT